jgi:hypothetical protein
MKVVRMSLKKGEISRFQQSGSAWILRKKENVVGRLSLNEPVKVCDTDLQNAPWDEMTRVYCTAKVDKFAFDKDSPDDVMVHLVLLEVVTPVKETPSVEPISFAVILRFNGRLAEHKAVKDIIFSNGLFLGYTEDRLAEVIFSEKSATEVLELIKPALKEAVKELRQTTTVSLIEWASVGSTLVTFGVDKSVTINRLD